MANTHARARARSRSEARSEGPAFLDDLLAMAGSLADSRKEFASAQLEDLADSVRQFSESLPALPQVRSYAETAAHSLESLASYVLESDLPEMMSDARDLARRHPLITFGGSVVAGVVITQLVQSRAETMRSALRSRRSARGRSRGRGEEAGDSGEA